MSTIHVPDDMPEPEVYIANLVAGLVQRGVQFNCYLNSKPMGGREWVIEITGGY